MNSRSKFIVRIALILLMISSVIFGQSNMPRNLKPGKASIVDFQSGLSLRDRQIMKQTYSGQRDSNTTLIGRWANGPCYAVDVSDNIAYFGNGGYLEIVDISDPANPIELGKIVTPSVVNGVAVSGSYAYVADGSDGLRIIDVSTPSNPTEVGSFDTGDWAKGVAVSGSYAYVADGSDGLRIIDVSTPSNPTEVGFFDTGDWAYGVAVSGSYTYVADGEDGLYIIRNDLIVGIEETVNNNPDQFRLLQNYPNPFNPITVIPYQLSQSSFVTLEVYNIAGQLIETLVNERRNAGYYTVQWDASKVGSGVYLFRIQAGDPSSGSGQVFSEVKKCVFIK